LLYLPKILPMKRRILLFMFFGCGLLFAQEEELANGYFERGEFEKALLTYQKLYQQKKNFKYFDRIIESLQQLERYSQSQELLSERLLTQNYTPLIVDLGYNYQLQGDQVRADDFYNQAIAKVDENPSYTYGIARRFEQYSLLDQALVVYKKGMLLNPDYNFTLQMARIYGEQGNIEELFSSYLDYVALNPSFLGNAKREFSDFVSENRENENNRVLRILLLKKLQATPDTYWYDLLSWLFIQQKEYNKAFTQEKALYKRNQQSLTRIIDLALTSMKANDQETATEIFNFILENSQDIQTLLRAQQYLLDMELEQADDKTLQAVNTKYETLISTYGINEQTLGLQIGYGNFLAFYNNQPEQASAFLTESLKLPLSVYEEADVKMKLADILVYQERFNEALIYYSQIQTNVKNSTVSQEARFKVAKTSYYKGDFDWAESQLKILKASTSQLIANDALDLKLLISDNKDEDSLQVALKLYAKADLMSFQNHNDKAIALLNIILTEHQGESIEDQALYMQAKLFEKTSQFDKAISNYEAIIANYRDEILADDAYFFLAELYEHQLMQPEKAKALYEKILFEHEDSIYFIEARKRFRMLRGDAIN